jgi:hypothetical protein
MSAEALERAYFSRCPYEDIYGLAKSRNAVFLKLLKNEFRVDC